MKKYAHNLHRTCLLIICKNTHIIEEFSEIRNFRTRNGLVTLQLPLKKKENGIKTKTKPK